MLPPGKHWAKYTYVLSDISPCQAYYFHSNDTQMSKLHFTLRQLAFLEIGNINSANGRRQFWRDGKHFSWLIFRGPILPYFGQSRGRGPLCLFQGITVSTMLVAPVCPFLCYTTAYSFHFYLSKQHCAHRIMHWILFMDWKETDHSREDSFNMSACEKLCV